MQMAYKSHVCGPCKDNNKVAVVYCNVCGTTLCERCQIEHGLVKILKSHTLRDVKELPPIEISDFLKSLIVCPNHDNEEVVYLCKVHDVACCNKCVIVKHRNCNELRVLADIPSNLNAEGVGLKNSLQELTKKGHDLVEH
ncbi:hypothetical protein DPMN_189836 [Dreissena polymorpha]|uniref:B box-type domain-containing protein n=1 Tax=Dreissena polymorpha TaxID=45954 RepID=A0A9D4DW73_DREPO|nr:hypothetical protein DPMN_189836 [Dreissena polymorpha]